MKRKISIMICFIGIIMIGVIAIVSIFGFKILSSYREINEMKSFSLEEMNELQITMTKENIRIIQKEGINEVRFHFHGKSKQDIKLKSTVNNATLIIEAQCEDNPLPRNYDPTFETLYLDIYIPENYNKNIYINTTLGKVTAEKLQADVVSINASSGDLDIGTLKSAELKITGKSSAIKINKCISKKASIKTSAGDIILKDGIGSFDIKSSSGKVQLSCVEYEDQDISITTSSGDISLLLPDSAEFILKASTSSGKLKSDFVLESAGNNSMSGQVGSKENKILLKSSSGSIGLVKLIR